MKNTYYVDYMSKWNRRWGILDAFTDMYEAVDYAVKVSKETEETYKEAKEMLKCYNENEPRTPHRIVKRRIPYNQ